MMLRFLLVLGAALGAFSGCTRDDPDHLVELVVKTPQNPGAEVILDVLVNGHVILILPRTGSAFQELDAAALADLDAQIRGARFPELAQSYGCVGCADEPYYVITAHVDGRAYEVSVDSAPGAIYPEGLRTLVQTLKRLSAP